MSDYQPKDDDLIEKWNRLKNAKEFSGYVDMMIAIDVVTLVKEVEKLREENEKISNRLFLLEPHQAIILNQSEKIMRYEKALKEIAESKEDTSCNEVALKYEVIAEKALYQ